MSAIISHNYQNMLGTSPLDSEAQLNMHKDLLARKTAQIETLQSTIKTIRKVHDEAKQREEWIQQEVMKILREYEQEELAEQKEKEGLERELSYTREELDKVKDQLKTMADTLSHYKKLKENYVNALARQEDDFTREKEGWEEKHHVLAQAKRDRENKSAQERAEFLQKVEGQIAIYQARIKAQEEEYRKLNAKYTEALEMRDFHRAKTYSTAKELETLYGQQQSTLQALQAERIKRKEFQDKFGKIQESYNSRVDSAKYRVKEWVSNIRDSRDKILPDKLLAFDLALATLKKYCGKPATENKEKELAAPGKNLGGSDVSYEEIFIPGRIENQQKLGEAITPWRELKKTCKETHKEDILRPAKEVVKNEVAKNVKGFVAVLEGNKEHRPVKPFVGLGIVARKTDTPGHFIIKSVSDGTPAHLAGLKPGQVIAGYKGPDGFNNKFTSTEHYLEILRNNAFQDITLLIKNNEKDAHTIAIGPIRRSVIIMGENKTLQEFSFRQHPQALQQTSCNSR